MNEGMTCPICRTGKVSVIKETLGTDEPLNQCSYCKNIINFVLEGDVEV